MEEVMWIPAKFSSQSFCHSTKTTTNTSKTRFLPSKVGSAQPGCVDATKRQQTQVE